MQEIGKKKLVRAQLAIQKAVSQFSYDPNVSLIDYGWRERDGKLLNKDEPCIRIHVNEKFTPGLALESAIEAGKTRGAIPDTIAGFPVDVPKGAYTLQQSFWGWSPGGTVPRARRIDPLKGGISISNAYRYGYGTLGGPVKDRRTGARMILSNWHVLGGSWWSRTGLPIYQPGRGDGGTRNDTVATLSRHAMSSGLDAAVAELTSNRQIINHQFDIKPVRGVGRAQLGMEVVKSGRKTDITYGRVTAIQGVIRLSYSGVNRLIRNVMTIEPRLGPTVSAGGDSGSFWLHESTMDAVGLHFAGGDRPERALALDMQSVLDALNVDLII